MARIMCTQRLWRAFGHGGRPPSEVAEPLIHGVALGTWATAVYRFDRRDLIIALNERTYLTLVFPLDPPDQFRANFANALSAILEDLGLPEDVMRLESAAVEFEPLARLTSRRLTSVLTTLKFICSIELDYHDDLRRVQLNLNEFPHGDLELCVPIAAVTQLFERDRQGRSFSSH